MFIDFDDFNFYKSTILDVKISTLLIEKFCRESKIY